MRNMLLDPSNYVSKEENSVVLEVPRWNTLPSSSLMDASSSTTSSTVSLSCSCKSNGWVLYRGGKFDYNDDILYVLVDPTVKVLVNDCFKGCSNLRKVFVVRKSLQKIQPRAFAYCYSLEHIRAISIQDFWAFQTKWTPLILVADDTDDADADPKNQRFKRQRPWK